MMSNSPAESERTSQEIDEVLNLAKLKKNDLRPLTQTIYISENNVHHSDLKLFQLNNDLLGAIEEGQTLVFKGDPDENVVLCSKTKTYDVNETETSNSLLLMENLKLFSDCASSNESKISKVTIHGIFFSYLEAVPGKPYLRKLERLLEESIYKGPEYEFNISQNKLMTFQDLDATIQCSSLELKNALENMDTVIIDDKIRLLHFEYHFRVLSYMLKLIDENSWDLDEIDFEITVESLQDIIPNEVLVSIFDKYAVESKVIDGKQLYSYKESDVCIFFAKVLLSQSGKFNLDEFLQAWKDSVPEGMIPDESMLYGIAIIDRDSNPNGIWAF
ncbi:hypothetical protein WA026_019058 [Henosepilachna vigintioctopunctata]|uniref:Sister chromatid cohesion protein DCC1 n=1 Tax=Henosepilachna vigintioctopunctata TaxID=420089 RepID=A0AAW1V975_9CUCU